MHTLYYIILIISVAMFASLFTLAAYLLFSKMAMLDAPDERSNHSAPVVTGVGAGVMIAILSFLVVVNAPPALVIGGIMLLVVSIMDDRKPLSPGLRLGVQALAVLLAVHVFDGEVFQGLLPYWLDMPLTALLWLWMINLTNFMDGIDEISIMESLGIAGGIVLLGMGFDALPKAVRADALVIAIGMASFYPWNKHPARCFLGDAGSVPLGYLLGYLLFSLAAAGAWAAALILPAYYLCDATLTLLKRAVKGQKIWTAHSEHCYQIAVRAGRSHAWASRHVMIVNVGLIILAGLSLYMPEQATMAVMAAYVLALLVCAYFAQQRARAGSYQVSNGTAA